MIEIIADNIISPLGISSKENYENVKAGVTGLQKYEHKFNLDFAFTASLMPEKFWEDSSSFLGLSRFEKMAVRSVQGAMREIPDGTDFDITSGRTLFILSSTKGNVELLPDVERVSLINSAHVIAQKLGITSTPQVVCNACISGVHALLVAKRFIACDAYDYVIVCGCDVQSSFTISGFQSLKALSASPCRPFDIDRNGLNLGEAAATVILHKADWHPDHWYLASGVVRNDAYHQTAPSPKATGLAMAIHRTMEDYPAEVLACVNTHGTSTLFNDEMEAVALSREGLADIPANSLKAYYGHTMGATGVLDIIITRMAVDDHTVLATKGFDELGVSRRVNIVTQNTTTDKQAFLKTIAGFGGCNAAILVAKGAVIKPESSSVKRSFTVKHQLSIRNQHIELDGQDYTIAFEDANEPLSEMGISFLKQVYKSEIGNYPRFYKMDNLSKLGFVASELLLHAVRKDSSVEVTSASSFAGQSGEDTAILLYSKYGSISTDQSYALSMQDIPSPHLFTYTLPNMVTGEIAIRQGYHGETSFCLLHDNQDVTALLREAQSMLSSDAPITKAIVGSIDYLSDNNFEAQLCFIDSICD